MDRWHCRTFRLPRLIVIAALLLGGLAWLCEPALALQNTENSYISPNFGYSIAWPMPWYASSESNDGTYDTLVLGDDESSVQFSGARFPNETLQEFFELNTEGFQSDPGRANVEQLPASECDYPTDGLVACIRYDDTFSDGSVNPIGGLVEARTMGEGVWLVMIALVPEPFFADYLLKWREIVAAGVGKPVPTPSTGNDWEIVEIASADYRIEPGVPALDRDLAIEGIEFARRTVQALAGPLNADRLTVTVRAGASTLGPDQYGFTRDNAIFIYTGSESWPTIAPIERLQGLVHEYFHIYQFDRLEQVDTQVPAWFLEGSADAFGFLAVSQLGVTEQLDFIRLSLNRVGENPMPGTLCSHVVNDETFTADAYSLAHLAIQDLLARNGQSIEALVQIFEEIGNGATFEDAFADTFEIDVDQFCMGLETWRTRLAPVDDVPPDLQIAEGQDLPSPVELTSAPAQAAPGEQVLFTVSTTAGANCQLELTPGKRSGAITEDTFANGTGEAFWLVIVPAESLPGEGMVEISCGGEVVQGQFTIT
jgi:hypothetical protein